MAEQSKAVAGGSAIGETAKALVHSDARAAMNYPLVKVIVFARLESHACMHKFRSVSVHTFPAAF
jgi:hypothetical protein